MSDLVKHQPAPLVSYQKEQLDLIKRTVAKGTTNDELQLFLYTASKTGLDPLLRQIHAVKRWSSVDKREVMSIQVGIDGLRLIADRTGVYAPGAPTTYEYDKDGKLVSATASVKKSIAGLWHEISETAYYEEYVATTRDGKPNATWGRLPRVMLAKCAEARALRRAFPAEMSGVYEPSELQQIGPVIEEKETVSEAEVAETPEAPKNSEADDYRKKIREAQLKFHLANDVLKGYAKDVLPHTTWDKMTADEGREMLEWLVANWGSGERQPGEEG